MITVKPTQLADFKTLMAKVPQQSFDYTRCLQDLQTHHTAITTNITNYGICLDKIQAIGNVNNPQSWQDFFTEECQKWQKQIQTDINYLTPGQELFGQLIDTIRGIVETQQAESDRSLENTINVLGIAFGGGAIVSGVVTQHIDKPFAPGIINFKYPIHPLVSSLLWSFLAIAFFWLVAKRKWR